MSLHNCSICPEHRCPWQGKRDSWSTCYLVEDDYDDDNSSDFDDWDDEYFCGDNAGFSDDQTS